LAAGRSLKFASFRGGCGDSLSILKQPTFQLRGEHSTT